MCLAAHDDHPSRACLNRVSVGDGVVTRRLTPAGVRGRETMERVRKGDWRIMGSHAAGARVVNIRGVKAPNEILVPYSV